MNVTKLLALALCLALLCSCDDANTCKAVERPKVIFDTDIVGSTDDLVALCALYKYMDEGKCDVIGIIVDREGEKNAACVDVFSEWGNVTIDSEGNTTFTATPNGNCRYQKPGDASWNSATLNIIRNLIKQ